MLIIPLILSAALDMSLPEFQPYEDASGNYLVSEYDYVNDEVVVSDVPSDDIVISDLSNNNFFSLSLNVDSSSEADAPIMREASGSVSYDQDYDFDLCINTSSSSIVGSFNNTILTFIYLPYAGTYTLFYSGSTGGSFYVFDSISLGSIYVSTLVSINSSNFTYDFTTNGPCYICGNKTPNGPSMNFSISGVPVVPDPEDPSGNDISGNDMSAVVNGLSVLNDTIVSGNDQIVSALEDLTVTVEINETDSTNKFRALIFVNLIAFLYPIALSIVKNIVGGDSNV